MESMMILHWSIVLICFVVLGYPIARVLKRLGYSPWWVIVAFIPIGNVIGLWVLSFADWPTVPDNRSD